MLVEIFQLWFSFLWNFTGTPRSMTISNLKIRYIGRTLIVKLKVSIAIYLKIKFRKQMLYWTYKLISGFSLLIKSKQTLPNDQISDANEGNASCKTSGAHHRMGNTSMGFKFDDICERPKSETTHCTASTLFSTIPRYNIFLNLKNVKISRRNTQRKIPQLLHSRWYKYGNTN